MGSVMKYPFTVTDRHWALIGKGSCVLRSQMLLRSCQLFAACVKHVNKAFCHLVPGVDLFKTVIPGKLDN